MDKNEKIESEIRELIDNEIEKNSAYLGMNVGTSGGTLIASKFKENQTDLSETEVSAAASSLLFLSDTMLKGSLNQEIVYNLIAGKKTLIISVIVQEIVIITYVNREFAELKGIDNVINDLKTFCLKVAAIVSTSNLLQEEVFVTIKRAIPNALVIAIITKEGMPIKIQSSMQEASISGLISALYNLSDVLSNNLEFSIISGMMGSIIIHELDESRILCVAVPEAGENQLGSYVVKIKDIIDKSFIQ